MTQTNGSRSAQARHAIVVVGMHRSGTSALAGALHHLGASLPEHPLPSNAQNPRGYFESQVFYELHDDLLRDAGSAWHQVKGPPRDWFSSKAADVWVERLAHACESEFAASPLFVLKDPRVSRLLPLWQRVFDGLGIHDHTLIAVRQPDAVARSLDRASRIPETVGRLLWLDHLLHAERDTRARPRAFVSYDMLLSDWRGAIVPAVERAAIPLAAANRRSEAEIDAFLSPASDQTSAHPGGHPTPHPWIEETYLALHDACSNDAPDSRTLDGIRSAFDTAEAALGPALADAEQRMRHEREQRVQQVARLNTLDAELEAGRARSRELQQKLARRREEAQELRKSIELLMRWVLDRVRAPDAPAPEEMRAALAAIEKAEPAEIPQIVSTAALLAEKNLQLAAFERERERRAAEIVEIGRHLAAAKREIEAQRSERSASEDEVARLRAEVERLEFELRHAKREARAGTAAALHAEAEQRRLTDQLAQRLEASPRGWIARLLRGRRER